ncbi:MAG: diguanylate cyclase [Lewinellaceae bacterium]|nr:hypothetical protein [Saprospiraceae bacterium]MCB9330936.1 diguanylate cyclase [Lewinellaceae bacterium]
MKHILKSTGFLTILIAANISCANQSYSNPETHAIQVSAPPQVNSTPVDTTLRLKFTSGIRSILEDSRGNIWFGSHQEGLCRFDGKNLTYFTEKDGLCNNQIRSIFEDSNGVVWFEGGKGISSYVGGIIITPTERNYQASNEWQIGENDLWFKGDETNGNNKLEQLPGVYRYDGNTLTYHVFPLMPKGDEGFHYSVSTPFLKGKNGMYWFGTYGAVIGYNGTSFTIIDDTSLKLNDATGHLHVRNIFEDSKGNLWIGNNGIGVWMYNGDTTINFSRLQGLISENSLLSGGYKSPAGSLEHVFSIGEDSIGNMWFGDRDTGAWRYDGKSMRNYTTKDGLTTTHIWQIYRSKSGELWFAMADGSVCKFDGESFVRIF